MIACPFAVEVLMIKQTTGVPVRSGTNYAAIDLGPLERLDEYELEVPVLKRSVKGKLLIRELLQMSGMQMSMNKLRPGAAVPFYHQHRENEEAYIFIGGRGQMQIDGDTFEVSEGSIVRVSTEGSRTLRNTSDGPLYYICVQARQGSLNIDTFADGIPSKDPVVWPEL